MLYNRANMNFRTTKFPIPVRFPMSHKLNQQWIERLKQLTQSVELSSFFSIIPGHIDVVVPPRYEFKSFIAVEIGMLSSQPFSKSHFLSLLLLKWWRSEWCILLKISSCTRVTLTPVSDVLGLTVQSSSSSSSSWMLGLPFSKYLHPFLSCYTLVTSSLYT